MATLASSARFHLFSHPRNWKLHKALLALNNAGIYLQPRYWLRRDNWAYLKARLNGLRRYGERSL